MFASFECDLFPIGASYSSVSFLGTSFTDVKDETTLRKKIIRLKKPGSNTFPRSTTPPHLFTMTSLAEEERKKQKIC
jgi:hypothetical protein